MAVAFVQASAVTQNHTAGGPQTETLTLNGTVGGSTIVVGVICGRGAKPVTVSDGVNTYTAYPYSETGANITDHIVYMFVAKNPGGGNLSIVVSAVGSGANGLSVNGNIWIGLVAAEFSGVDTTTPVEPGGVGVGYNASDDVNSGSNAVVNSGNVTIPANGLAVGFAGDNNNSTYTLGAGWTNRANSTSYRLVTNASAGTAALGGSVPSDPWSAAVVVLQAASATSDMTGSSAGAATPSGVGASTANLTGASAGAGTPSAVGAATKEATGASAGAATPAGVAAATKETIGASAGAATPSGVGASTVYFTGASAGVAVATGVGPSAPSVAEMIGAAYGQAVTSGISGATRESTMGMIFFPSMSLGDMLRSVTLHRAVAGSYNSHGKLSKAVEQLSTISAIIYPPTGAEIKRLPEGRYVAGGRTFLTDVWLQAGDGGAADMVEFEGFMWEVTHVDLFAPLNFYRAFVVRRQFTGPQRWNILPWWGQSIATGFDGAQPLTTVVPAGTLNKKFSGGVVVLDQTFNGPHAVGDITSLVPLVEGNGVETGMAECANRLAALHPGERFIGVSFGVASTALSARVKGTNVYANALTVLQRIVALLPPGDTARILVLPEIGGESDIFSGQSYLAELTQLQLDINVDWKGITGQVEDIPILCVGQYLQPGGLYDTDQAMIDAVLNLPGRFHHAGGQYQFRTTASQHHTNQGYRSMGYTIARAIDAIIYKNQNFRAMVPTSVIRSGAFIDITYEVPTPPLQFRADIVEDRASKGFEFFDDGGPSASVVSAALTGPNTIRVTLSQVPTAANKRLVYAHTPGTARGAFSGSPPLNTGRRGNVCDSSAEVDSGGLDLRSYGASFSITVT